MGGGGDAEQAHQPERVGAFGRFVEDAVLAQIALRQPAGRAPRRSPMLAAGWSGPTAVFWGGQDAQPINPANRDVADPDPLAVFIGYADRAQQFAT